MKGEPGPKLQKYLREKIPLVKALKAEIREIHPDCVELWAPLAPNHNHMGSAFGGSISALLILGGYTWLYQFMLERGYDVHVILKSCEIDYKFPIEENLQIFARSPQKDELEKFLKSFQRKGLGRITIESEIKIGGRKAAVLSGEYVVKSSDATN